MASTVAGIHLTGIHASRPAANAAGLPVGTIYACSTHSLIYQTDGSSWTTWATLGGTYTDPLTTRGDIVTRGAATTGRLAVGAANRLLRSDGTDPSWGQVVEADLGLTDITTADATTSAHGFLPKLGGGTTNFLRADGTWNAPAGGGGGTSLASASVTHAATDETITSTTFADVPTMTVTLTTGAHRCLVTVDAVAYGNSNQIQLDVNVDGTRIGSTYGLVFQSGSVAFDNKNMSFSCITAALTAASHTIKLQGRVDSGSMVIRSSLAPFILTVVELYA